MLGIRKWPCKSLSRYFQYSTLEKPATVRGVFGDLALWWQALWLAIEEFCVVLRCDGVMCMSPFACHDCRLLRPCYTCVRVREGHKVAKG